MQPAEYAAATFGSPVFNFYTDKGLIADIDGANMDTLVFDAVEPQVLGRFGRRSSAASN